MKCIICNNDEQKIFEGFILNKYKVKYYQCTHCGLINTEKPYWLKEAYDDSITIYDTGIMQRNISFSIITMQLLRCIFLNKNTKFLDWGGGYGIFTRLMRDLGYDFYWKDKYSKCLVARGFEGKKCSGEKYDIVTAFELFEHFSDPVQEIKEILSYTDIILFSTLLYSERLEYPELSSWWYYIPEEGQHISFYSKITLEHISNELGVFYYKLRDNLHVYSKHKLNYFLLKFLINNKISYLISLYKWEKLRSGSAASGDMNFLLEGK